MLDKLMILKNQKKNQEQQKNKKISKENLFTIISACLLVLAHIAIVLAIILSFRYYAIYPALFGSLVAIVVCVLIIGDIIFFVGFNHKVLALKIISITLAVMLLIGGTVGSYFIGKANGIVNSVLDSSPNSTKYETYSGIFVSYNKNKTYSSLKELHDQRIGFITETSDGITSIAEGILKSEKVEYNPIYYKTNAELVQALIDTDIDVMVITSAYRSIYSLERDENSPFAKYLDDFSDFYSFEKELKVKNERKNKNISKDPFNVLLIGYSRTDIGSPVGLADSIIVATINPQTYTVSMMSIARDSFVPIPCYGGEYDKINSGRSTSRACFVETVESFIGMDIDYYMELDYLGLVSIVDAIGGIHINNPVEFELDGIYVPAGENVFADGQMALQFCRERHHMPGGDFDRQQHQKEVIIEIAKKFVRSGDISLALNAMQEAADFMSTDMTLDQLTSIFNLILNTKNYTTLDTFDLIDFQTLRITGEGGLKYYSYSMHLPLWVYLIYQGSYDESINHINEVLGKNQVVKQDKNFSFSCQNLYNRPLFYSLSYPEKFMFTPDPMPAYWLDLEGLTLEEAMAWASANGVKIDGISYITMGSPEYKAELEGLVCGQSVRYGSLVSEYPVGDLVIMGSGQIDESKVVPNFEGHGYSRAIEWANKFGIPYSIDFDTSASGNVGEVVKQTPSAYTSIDNCEKLKIVVKAGTYTIKFDKNGHGGTDVPANITVTTGDSSKDFVNMSTSTESGTNYLFDGWYTSATGGTKVTNTSDVTGSNGSTVTVYAHWIKDINITLDPNDGTGDTSTIKPSGTLPTPKYIGNIFDGWYTSATGGTKVTDLSTLTDSVTLYAHWTICSDHTYDDGVTTIQPTCETEGELTKTCTKCGATVKSAIPALGHTPINVDPIPATCGTKGMTAGTKCSVCEKILSGCEETDATGLHAWDNGVDTDDDGTPDLWTCTNCGETSEAAPN